MKQRMNTWGLKQYSAIEAPTPTHRPSLPTARHSFTGPLSSPTLSCSSLATRLWRGGVGGPAHGVLPLSTSPLSMRQHSDARSDAWTPAPPHTEMALLTSDLLVHLLPPWYSGTVRPLGSEGFPSARVRILSTVRVKVGLPHSGQRFPSG
ncbi:hypothetical protein E2C01_045484 [Portunus trituberculatus]|uniref:Uncharacterized protein n=1 Tax=Portunus trituberculatus TaxID=210409 RepID=A0A5B7G304_PORTR|nr:hypothetical protein [Portunus trituberculatus]